MSADIDGNNSFTANKDFNGIDTFTYYANDAHSNSNTVTWDHNRSAVLNAWYSVTKNTKLGSNNLV